MRKNIYSVGQVNTYIQNMFAQDFMLHQISIKGEVSNCKYHSSGHIYFTLKDQTGTIAAVMFSRYRRGLAFQMKEGDKVVVTGSVEVYERDGKYQLYAREIELEGAGNLYLKFEALKRELEEMGMFDAAYKKPIPRYATRIGIVTADPQRCHRRPVEVRRAGRYPQHCGQKESLCAVDLISRARAGGRRRSKHCARHPCAGCAGCGRHHCGTRRRFDRGSVGI